MSEETIEMETLSDYTKGDVYTKDITYIDKDVDILSACFFKFFDFDLYKNIFLYDHDNIIEKLFVILQNKSSINFKFYEAKSKEEFIIRKIIVYLVTVINLTGNKKCYGFNLSKRVSNPTLEYYRKLLNKLKRKPNNKFIIPT